VRLARCAPGRGFRRGLRHGWHGRNHFAQRVALLAQSSAQASDALRAWAEGQPSLAKSGAHLGASAPEVVFLFTGQGSQYVGMGRSLYEQAPVFRAALERCDTLLRAVLPHSILDVLFDIATARGACSTPPNSLSPRCLRSSTP